MSEQHLGHLKPIEKTGEEPMYVGSAYPIDFGGAQSDYETDYERDVIFAQEIDEASGTFNRLVKRTETRTYSDGRVEVNEYLAVEYLRAQVGGGHYVRDHQSVEVPASRAGRTELLINLAATLGLDVRID